MKSPMSIFRFLSTPMPRKMELNVVRARRESQPKKFQKTYIRPNRPVDTRARKC